MWPSVRPPLERPAAHIDPRIRARRIEVQRGRRPPPAAPPRRPGPGRWPSRSGSPVALRSPLLDVDDVQVVRGPSTTPAAAVVEAAGHRAGRPARSTSTSAGRRERVAALPWVGEVRAPPRPRRARWTIAVTERDARRRGGRRAPTAVLVDAEGRVAGPAGRRARARRRPRPGRRRSTATSTPGQLARRRAPTTPWRWPARLAAVVPGLIAAVPSGDGPDRHPGPGRGGPVRRRQPPRRPSCGPSRPCSTRSTSPAWPCSTSAPRQARS